MYFQHEQFAKIISPLENYSHQYNDVCTNRDRLYYVNSVNLNTTCIPMNCCILSLLQQQASTQAHYCSNLAGSRFMTTFS